MGESHACERVPDDAEGSPFPAASLASPPPVAQISSGIWKRSAEQAESVIRTRPCRTALLPPLRQLARRLVVMGLLFLILFPALIASWPIVPPSTAFALAFHNPDPALSTPSWLLPSTQPNKQPNLNKSATSTNNSIPSHTPPPQWQVSMQPAKVALTNAAQHFVSSDGQLLVDIPAGSLDATQLAQQQCELDPLLWTGLMGE